MGADTNKPSVNLAAQTDEKARQQQQAEQAKQAETAKPKQMGDAPPAAQDTPPKA
jgi:hypothetical protein